MPIKVPVVQTGLEKSIQNAAKSAGKNLKINLGTNAKDIKSLSQPLGRITGQADDFTKSMEAANARVLAFGASVGIINSVVQSFKALVSTTIEVEKSLTKINSILQTNVAGLNALKGQIFDIAKGTEQTFDTVAEAALELSRQGLSATEVTKRLNDSLILSRLSGISAAEAVSGLTAAVNSFTKAGLTTGEVLNKISNAANQFAVSERDLIEGFKRSASVAELAGVSIDELGGIITAVQQKTARGGAVIGNSFKTIFTRIGRSENLDLLSSLGVQVTDIQGKILPATKLIENLAKEIENLGDVEVREITQKIGGGFQIAPLLAALSDYSSETSVAIQATEAFRNASDQAYKKNEALNQTLSAAINRTTLSVKELANTLGELGVTDTFRTLLDFFNNLATGAEKILDGEGLGGKFARGIVKGLGTALIQGGLALFGVLILKLSSQLAKFGLESVKTFFNLNKEAKRVAATQQQIIGTLLSDKSIREQILKIENSSVTTEQKRAQQAQFFNEALKQQLSTLSQINAISAGIASPVARSGSVGRAKRAAGGYLPVGAEQKDINSGVGGAPRGSKPVVIPNFAFGGGQKGTMVANNSEYIVPNFAGGGSAIFNQDMVKSMGLPSGAKKINAAGGFVPNFATQRIRPVNTDGKSFVLLTGKIGRDSQERLFAGLNKKGQTQVFADPRDAKSKGLTNISSVDVPTYQMATKRGDPPADNEIGGLMRELEDYAVKVASEYNDELGIGKITDRTSDIKNSLNQGSLKGFAGTVFESSLAGLLGSSDFKKYTGSAANSRIDLPYSPEVYDLFGVPGGKGSEGAEVKSSDNLKLKKSAAKKFFDVLTGRDVAFNQKKPTGPFLDEKAAKSQYNLTTQEFRQIKEDNNITGPGKPVPVSALQNFRRSASGYIPNFAGGGALEDAIQREKEAGVPINQVRINQDGKLRNSQNPNGLAVTNTRDEPTGAIPKNAARGFVPNFQGGFGPNLKAAQQTEKIPSAAFEKGAKSIKKLGKAADKTADSSIDAAGKLFGISAIGFAVQGALGGLATEADNVTKGFLDVTQGVTQATTTLFALQSLGIKPGFGAGVKKGGVGRNLSASGLKGARSGRRQFKGGGTGGIIGGGSRFLAGGAKFGLGKVLSTFGRFVPLLGTAIIGFQALNPILKLVGIDLGKIGSTLLQKIGVIDSPAEKAAQSLRKLSDEALKADFGKGPINVATRALKDLNKPTNDKGETIKDPIEALAKTIKDSFSFVEGKAFKETTTRRISSPSSSSRSFNGGFSGGFNTNSGNLKVEEFFLPLVEGGRKKITKEIYELYQETAKIAAEESATGILKTLSESSQKKLLSDPSEENFKKVLEDRKKAIEKAGGNFQKFESNVQEVQKLKGEQKELARGNTRGKNDKELNKIKAKLAELNKENEAYLDLSVKITEQETKTETAAERVKKVRLEILKTQRQSLLDRQSSIAAIKSEVQFALELKAASEDTGEVEKKNIEQQIRGLESQKKLSLELSKAFTKRIESSDNIRRAASVDGEGKVDEAKYNKITAILTEANSKILQGLDYNQDVSKELDVQLKGLIDNEDLRKRLLQGIGAEQKAIKAGLIVERARNELAKARLDILKAQAKEEERAQKIRDRALASSRSSEDSQSRQADLDIERRRLLLEGGNIGKGSRGSFSNSEKIANLGIEKAQKDAALALRNLIRSLQDELIRDVRSSGLSGADKRTFEKDITGAKTEEQIVAITGRAETAIIAAEKKAAEGAKARRDAALEIIKAEKLNIANFGTAITSLANLGTTLPLTIAAAIAQNGTGATTAGKPEGVVYPAFGPGAAGGGGIEGYPQRSNVDGDGLLPRQASAPAAAADPVQEASRTAEEIVKAENRARRLRQEANKKEVLADAQAAQRAAQVKKRLDDKNAEGDKQVENAAQEATNTTNALSAALTNFNNIGRNAVQGLGDNLAQSQFDAFTSADPSQIQSSLRDIRGVGVAKDSLAQGDSNEDAIRKQQEFLALEARRAEIRKTISTANKVDLEFELEKTQKILALRNKFKELIKKPGNDEALAAIEAQIAAEEKATQSLGDRLKKIGITGEESSERLKISFAEGADEFVSTLSSGIADAIVQGKSLGDVLRSAASDFASRMAKASLDNLFRQGAGAFGSIFSGGAAPVARAEGGMISGGSGTKDDVPAVLMGGEYVMKKSAVQKYGPNFMNALNQGNIKGYNQGGMVRAESGTVSSSWTPASDETEEKTGSRKPSRDVRTESGLLASSWTRESSYIKAKKSELDKGIDYRSDSGLLLSRWTPKTAYEGKQDFEKEYFEDDAQEAERTESGLISSKWIREASAPNVKKSPSKGGRTESGLESSRWTAKSSEEKRNGIETSVGITGRTQSGLAVSRWNSEAQPSDATNTSSFGKSIAADFINEIKNNSSKIIPTALAKSSSSAVPAMVTGGEYLLNKKSTSKYSSKFLNDVNNGKIQKFANGGLVQNIGDQDYFAPGLFGGGNITGADNLLNFATQGFTSGRGDFISSSGGAAAISLEPESVRLTNFGRNRDSPLRRITQDAKDQAFDLNQGYQKEYFQYLKEKAAQEKAKRDRKKAFKRQLLFSVATMALSAGLSGIASGASGGQAAGLGGFDLFKAGAKGFFTGGKLPGMNSNSGGLINMFSGSGSQRLPDLSQYAGSNWNESFMTDDLRELGLRDASRAYPVKRATGGYVAGRSGIDNVPAMLTGGEFVLNSAATQRLGSGNLESLNAGSGGDLGQSGGSEELIVKLDELIEATKENAGEINITVTGAGGGNSAGGAGTTEQSESSGAAAENKSRQDLAKEIKVAVLQVIMEEKRLGGTLRT